jgi:hypothetical protein
LMSDALFGLMRLSVELLFDFAMYEKSEVRLNQSLL